MKDDRSLMGWFLSSADSLSLITEDERLRSGDGDGDGLSFLLGLVFFSMMVAMVVDHLPLVSLGLGSILISRDMKMMVMMMVMKGEEDQTIEEVLDLW